MGLIVGVVSMESRVKMKGSNPENGGCSLSIGVMCRLSSDCLLDNQSMTAVAVNRRLKLLMKVGST
jgi:hypothetical protein